MRLQRHLLQHTSLRANSLQTSKLYTRSPIQNRTLSTLPTNPHIVHPAPGFTTIPTHILTEKQYIHASPSPPSPTSTHSHSHSHSTIYTLTFSPHAPSPRTAIGYSTTNPPTPGTFQANSTFTRLLHETLARHAAADPSIRAAAVAFAATNVALGAGVGIGDVRPSASASAGLRRGGTNARSQSGGKGGKSAESKVQEEGEESGFVGFMHIADERNPAVYGRIPEPEDIFGTLQVGPQGRFVDGNGAYQESGTYRVLTREGCLGLSDFLRTRLIERLAEEDGQGGR